jgi:hypothetical protein
MHEALAFLGELNDVDIEWILKSGSEQQVIANTVIIKEGEHPDDLYIVLSGLVRIHVSSCGVKQIAVLGPGELLGEISFLENIPASATVVAAENSLLLALPREVLRARIEEEPAFASRLYKSFALISTRRLRERVGALGGLLRAKSSFDDFGDDRWRRIGKTMDDFKQLMQKADEQALKNNGVIPEALVNELPERFMVLVLTLNAEIGDESAEHDHIKDEIGARVQREFLPFLLLTQTGERMYAKPRGYAGDFLTIDWIYRNQPGGVGRIGPLLDRAILGAPAVQAVKNRRRLLAGEIMQTLEKSDNGPVRVTSLACGPGQEIFDVMDRLDDPLQLHATLIDIDLQALAYVADKLSKHKSKRRMDLIHGNLVYLATGRQSLALNNQDLVYSIGLIDYFNDKFVVALLDYIYGLVAPGGKVILGNFHKSNPCKAFSDHVLDWKLNHRDEADMNRLYSASRFGRGFTNIRFEEEGVNMFAECRKK